MKLINVYNNDYNRVYQHCLLLRHRVMQPIKKFPVVMKLQVHLHEHTIPSLDLIVSQLNSLHIFKNYFSDIYLNIIPPSSLFL
jgi:hypothetical protein